MTAGGLSGVVKNRDLSPVLHVKQSTLALMLPAKMLLASSLAD